MGQPTTQNNKKNVDFGDMENVVGDVIKYHELHSINYNSHSNISIAISIRFIPISVSVTMITSN